MSTRFMDAQFKMRAHTWPLRMPLLGLLKDQLLKMWARTWLFRIPGAILRREAETEWLASGLRPQPQRSRRPVEQWRCRPLAQIGDATMEMRITKAEFGGVG